MPRKGLHFLLEAEAKERQGTRTDIHQKIDEGDAGQALDKAAELVGSNRQYVSEAKKLVRPPDFGSDFGGAANFQTP